MEIKMIPHIVTMDENQAVIDIACIECNVNHTIVLDKERYIKWQTGTPIQRVFPEIDLDTRELMISGICGPCFDRLFGESPSFLPNRLIIQEEYDRTRNLHPDYEMKAVYEHGTGIYPVNKKTGEVCDCKMEWNEDGTILSCPICGLDGT